MKKPIRVRFAPSPTGGLHLGGVRTALFNYLFAKKHQGTFILRIEDTDQNRFVEGAEEYIVNCLKWCGIEPDESPQKTGNYGPYRQSERKQIYKQYAKQLVVNGYAYYAFDTAEELNAKRKIAPNFQYDQKTRMELRNSLTLSEAEVKTLLARQTPHVIRIKTPENETVSFVDSIRGEVRFDTGLIDDKVLLKADGMPTYHLAVVVDDKTMEISHVFRGEEWLPSAPIHILLWKCLGWENEMPKWIHLPLILKPDGNGKLSKRDADRLGFPVYAMDWIDPKSKKLTKGFKEQGFLPEAFVNMLGLLGWNDGSQQEIFSLTELVEAFEIDRIGKAGAKFDFEKAKWFNREWIKASKAERLLNAVKQELQKAAIAVTDDRYLCRVIDAVKDRCTLLSDFITQGAYFFQYPKEVDAAAVKPKWTSQKASFFDRYASVYDDKISAIEAERQFKILAEENNLKPGEMMLPLRIMLVGRKFGPGIFEIAKLLGKETTRSRIISGLRIFAV